jgi:hypothetical protein
MPVLGVRQRAVRDVEETWRWRLRKPLVVAARIGYVILLYAVGVALLGGAICLVALGSRAWPSKADSLWALLSIVCILGVSVSMVTLAMEDVSWVFGAFAACALLAVLVSAAALSLAMNERALRDRGVVERAVVVAEHYQCVSDGEGNCSADYSYTLRSTADRPIRPDLDNGSDQLAVGSRITVLADPLGRLHPSTNTHLSAGPSSVTATVAGAVAAAFLLVAACAAPRPSRLSPGRG